MIVSLYAALLVILYIRLALNVVNGRWKYMAARGDGGESDLQMRIRAHGNLAEYAPFFLILLGLAEYNGLNPWVVHGFGIVFFLGRLSHVYSLLRHEKYDGEKLTTSVIFRRRGMQTTLFSMLGLAIILIIQFILAQL